MMVLPLLDIVGRKLHAYFNFVPVSPIPGSLALVQHATLAIMMFGGAIAAREGKLLQLATTASMIPDRYKTIVRVVTTALGAAITAYLVKASFQFSMIEKGVGDIIAIGISKWFILFFLPVGFSMILARMIWRVSDKNSLRLLTLVIAVGLASLGPIIHGPSETFIYSCFGLLMVAVVLGMPVFLVLGGAALIFLWNSDTPIDSIPAETYRMVVSPTIPTIPLFTLTGYFLAEGGASQRLLRVFQAFFGSLRGGPAIVTALVCAFFTCFTGGSGVTILALGGLLMPILIAEKYKERDALGLLTSAGSLGMLFPPSLPVILYGVVSHTPIDQLFLGGLVPGILLLVITAWWGVVKGSKAQASKHPFHKEEALSSAWAAKWELLLPFVVFFFLFIVKVTLVESAALTALYAFVVEVIIYRELKFKNVPRVITECGILVGGVLLILGVSLGFTNDMVDAQVPAHLAASAMGIPVDGQHHADRGGKPAGDFCRHCSGGAAAHAHGRRFWGRPGTHGDYLSSQYGAGLPGPAPGAKPFLVVLPLQETHDRGLYGGAAHVHHFASDGLRHYLYSVPHHGFTPVALPIT
jgi:tripartite ATP-independent transporter DctM subunit